MSKLIDAATCTKCNLTSQETLEGKPCPGCTFLEREPDAFEATNNSFRPAAYKGAGMEPYDSGFGRYVR